MPKYLDDTGLATNIQIAKDTFMPKMTVDSSPTANSTNLVTSGGVKTAVDAKQDTISDLATIRSGAALGATALQSYTETDPTVPAWAKAASKPTYTASEVGALPSTTTIPTKTSDLTNDSGFVTTDEQLKTEGIPQTTGGMYYPVLSTGANTGSKFVETNTGGLRYLISNGKSILILGNASNSSGSGLNRRGVIRLYNSDTSYTDISVSGAANKTIYLPSQEGRVALLSDIPTVPTKTSDLTNDSGFITNAGVTSFNGSTGAITYTAPVTSVNGNTGAVTISVPTKTSDLTNDSGFLTSAPVTSVNGATGAVTISVPTATSDLTNDSGFQSLAYTAISSASSTTALVWKTMYQWTVNPTSITLTLPSAPSDPRGEIVLKFTTGSTAPTVTWPSGLKWANGEEITPEASTTYEFSIGYDMMGGWTILGCGFTSAS